MFLVVATDSSNGPAHLLAAHICSVLWQVARIVNVVVLIPNQFAYRPPHSMCSTNTTATDRLNLYTWYPLKLGGCEKVQDDILVDEWLFAYNDRFSVSAYIYPEKVPTNFMGFPIKVAVLGYDTSVIIIYNYTQNDCNTAYKLTNS